MIPVVNGRTEYFTLLNNGIINMAFQYAITIYVNKFGYPVTKQSPNFN